MGTYNTVARFIQRIKQLEKKELINDEMIKKIVNESDVFPEEEKEYMFQFMKEEEGESYNCVENKTC